MEINIESGLSLTEAARTGNIGDLYALIKQDPKILERINENPFADTTFHIAAVEGQINFAMEMMNLEPSFAKKLNQDGFSPLHLALINGHTKLVLRLLKADKRPRSCQREGMTPLHCVVKMGDSNLLYEFLQACPECIEDVTVQGETALHFALKSDQIEAFKLLIGWLQRSRHDSASYWEKKIVSWRDNDDNTVLHIAARREQHQALRFLLDSFLPLNVKAKNSECLTALDIVKNVERNLSNEQYCSNDANIDHLKMKVGYSERYYTSRDRAKNRTPMEMITALLVITALVITATYQSSLSPPGGVWQGDNISTANTNITSNVTHHFLDHNSYSKSSTKDPFRGESRKAGTTIMTSKSYTFFWYFNIVSFLSAIALTIILLPDAKIVVLFLFPLFFLLTSYFYSMKILSPSTAWSKINLVFVYIFGCYPLLAIFTGIIWACALEIGKLLFTDRSKLLKVLK